MINSFDSLKTLKIGPLILLHVDELIAGKGDPTANPN